MIYLVEGRDKDSGKRIRLRVEADSEVEALRRASRRGLVDLSAPVEEARVEPGAATADERPGVAPAPEAGGSAGSRAEVEAEVVRRGKAAREYVVPPTLPSEMLGLLLPMVRRGPKRRFLAVTEEGLIVGREPRSGSPVRGTEAVRAFVGVGRQGRLRGWRYAEVTGMWLAGVDSSREVRLTVVSGRNRWSGIVPTVMGSLPVQAIERMWGRAPEAGRMRPRPARWVLRGLLTMIAALLLMLCVSAVWQLLVRRMSHAMRSEAWGVLLWGGGLLALTLAVAWWQWHPRAKKPPRRRRRRGRRRLERLGRVARAARFDVVLRLGGVAALVYGLGLHGRVVGWFNAATPMEMAVNPMARLVLGVAWVVLTLPGVVFITWGYVLSKRSGAEVMARDRRAPVLYLRSFGDDGRHTFTEESRWARLCGLVTPRELELGGRILRHLLVLGRWESIIRLPVRMCALALGRGSDTAEEQLVHALGRVGPTIAVGDPGEALPTPGAARVYLEHGEWQERVREMIRGSALVIVQPAATEGVWWELETTLREQRPERVLVCLQALSDDDVKDVALARLGSMLTGARLDDEIRDAAFLAFSAEWKPTPVPRAELPPLTWPWKGTSADLRRTLAPVVRGLGGADSEGPVADDRPLRRGGPARATAGLLYGVGPVAVIVLLASLPLIVHGLSPSVSGAMRLRERDEYRVELDRRWRLQKSEERSGVRTEVFGLGWSKRLVMIQAPRRVAGIEPVDAAECGRLALELVPTAGRMVSAVPPAPLELGGWPWRRSAVYFADERAGTRTRVQFWVLEASARRFVVACVETQPAVRGAMSPSAWDEALFASVESGLETFSPLESVHFPLLDGALSLNELRRAGYRMRPAKEWTDGPSQHVGWDRTLSWGAHRLTTVVWQGRVEDEMMAVRRLIENIEKRFPGAAVECTRGGWSKIEGRLYLEARFVVRVAGGEERIAAWISRALSGDRMVEGHYEAVDGNEWRLARAERDVRAMMASMSPE